MIHPNNSNQYLTLHREVVLVFRVMRVSSAYTTGPVPIPVSNVPGVNMNADGSTATHRPRNCVVIPTPGRGLQKTATCVLSDIASHMWHFVTCADIVRVKAQHRLPREKHSAPSA